jgi:N-acetylmuramoyl-L-alanine amidase
MPCRGNRQAILVFGFFVTFGLAQFSGADALASEPCGSKPRASFKIALDVGHGPDRPGAISARGVTEYHFNDRLVAKISEALVREGFSSTSIIKEKGSRAALFERPRRAKEMNADLLLSVHHDSVQDSYLQKWTYRGRKQMYSDKFSGFSVFVSKKNPRFDDSLRFAIAVADALKTTGMKFTLHHAENIPGERRELLEPDRGVYRYDQLVVLRDAEMPAVLLEAGVIVNRDEELTLSSDSYRQSIAEAVTNAVAEFCRTRATAAE